MTMTARPRIAEFEARAEQAFTAATVDGEPAGTWRLMECKALPAPDLPQLAGLDCYSLTFCHGVAGLDQATYRLEAEDGFSVAFFAVPVAADRMSVTVY